MYAYRNIAIKAVFMTLCRKVTGVRVFLTHGVYVVKDAVAQHGRSLRSTIDLLSLRLCATITVDIWLVVGLVGRTISHSQFASPIFRLNSIVPTSGQNRCDGAVIYAPRHLLPTVSTRFGRRTVSRKSSSEVEISTVTTNSAGRDSAHDGS